MLSVCYLCDRHWDACICWAHYFPSEAPDKTERDARALKDARPVFVAIAVRRD